MDVGRVSFGVVEVFTCDAGHLRVMVWSQSEGVRTPLRISLIKDTELHDDDDDDGRGPPFS